MRLIIYFKFYWMFGLVLACWIFFYFFISMEAAFDNEGLLLVLSELHFSSWFSVKRKLRGRFTMFPVRGTSDLDVRLMRRHLISWKVCNGSVVCVILLLLLFVAFVFDTSVSFWIGLPGVLFVLPDSYVDPEYKDYGGEDLRMPWINPWAFDFLSF